MAENSPYPWYRYRLYLLQVPVLMFSDYSCAQEFGQTFISLLFFSIVILSDAHLRHLADIARTKPVFLFNATYV